MDRILIIAVQEAIADLSFILDQSADPSMRRFLIEAINVQRSYLADADSRPKETIKP